MSRWRRQMTTLFGQHGCSKNNVPILLLYWAKCLLQMKAGKINPVLPTYRPGSSQTTVPSSPSIPSLDPAFLLYRILEVFATQAPPKWKPRRCGPLIKWVRSYIQSHWDAFHGLQTLPSALGPRGGQDNRRHWTGWRRASTAGLLLTGSQISPSRGLAGKASALAERRNMPAGVTKWRKWIRERKNGENLQGTSGVRALGVRVHTLPACATVTY